MSLSSYSCVDLQSLPVQYQLTTLPNNYVSYRVQVQGDFYAHFNFNSYPFDRCAESGCCAAQIAKFALVV